MCLKTCAYGIHCIRDEKNFANFATCFQSLSCACKSLASHTVGGIKTVTFTFRTVPSKRNTSVPFTVPFPFRTRKRLINTLGVSYRRVKNQSRSSTRIDVFILLRSSQLHWVTVLLPLFDFERVLRSPLDCEQILLSKTDRSTIANRFRSPLKPADRLK
jgi:hypothetical protein